MNDTAPEDVTNAPPEEPVEKPTTAPEHPLRSKTPIIIGAIAAVIAVLTAREFFFGTENKSGSERAFSGPLVGEIQSIEGQVLIRPPRGTRFEAAKPGPYRAESVLQTQAASSAIIEFRSGPTLRLLENSRLVTEVDSSRDDAIQVTVLAGEVAVLNPGTNDSFTLIYNGVEVPFRDGGELPSAMVRTVPLITIGPGLDDPAASVASSDLEEKLEIEKEAESVAPPAETEIPTNEKATEKANEKAKSALAKHSETSGLLHSTLTNDDIRTQVRAQGGSFQKCYVTMVNRMSESGVSAGALPKGETRVAFKILPTGKVEEHRVIRSPFGDATFDRCIAEAVGRLRFRQFQGAAIPVGEFPIVLE